jgi:nucleoside-diphosphate-sugar epimerase
VILYNGATGGLGRYLAETLSRLDETSHPVLARLEDRATLERELDGIEPRDPVTFIHLAARVSVPACEADPIAAREINVSLAQSTVSTVLDWASCEGLNLRVIYVSSGHVYAAQASEARLTEESPTRPRSVYARTKLEAEQVLASLSSRRGIPFLAARVFGLLAPQQAPNYVLPALIKRVRTADLNAIPGLDFTRDYLDARDVCEDLVLLASAPWPKDLTVVNVCSGVPVTIRELLRAVIDVMVPIGADDLARQAHSGPGRADDVQWVVGDPSRFRRLTGANSQRIALSQSVEDAIALAER